MHDDSYAYQGASIPFLAAGAGSATVLLLHGWASAKESWRATIAALAPYARVLAPDLPGHGTAALQGPARMAELAGAVAALCSTQGVERAAVVGHSMGGNVAVELALAHPECVGRLVLVNPALQGADMPIYTRSYLHKQYGWAMLRAAMAVATGLDALADRVPARYAVPLLIRPLRRYRQFARHDPDALSRLLAGLMSNPLRERLPQLRVPTTVVAGRFDPLVPIGHSRRLAAAIPGAQLFVMRQAGHDPMYECPQAFAQLLLEILGFADASPQVDRASMHQAAP
jgi:pimeloyl-ACP methyl ester carboxylesterase